MIPYADEAFPVPVDGEETCQTPEAQAPAGGKRRWPSVADDEVRLRDLLMRQICGSCGGRSAVGGADPELGSI